MRAVVKKSINSMNLCNIYNFAPHYREPIFHNRHNNQTSECYWLIDYYSKNYMLRRAVA